MPTGHGRMLRACPVRASTRWAARTGSWRSPNDRAAWDRDQRAHATKADRADAGGEPRRHRGHHAVHGRRARFGAGAFAAFDARGRAAMNRLGVLLVMPWVASAKYARLLTVLFVGVALIAAIALAVAGGNRTHRVALILVLGCAVWALWSSYLAANLQLARNARDLCLPRLQCDADLSLLLFAVVSVAVPTALCWMLGAAPLLAVAVFIVAAALGLAYMLLPLWIGVPLLMAAVFGIMTHGLAESLSTWWGLAALLVGFDVFRWWQLRTAT